MTINVVYQHLRLHDGPLDMNVRALLGFHFGRLLNV